MVDKLLILKDELKIPVQAIADGMGVKRQTIYRMLDGQAWTVENEKKLTAYLERLHELIDKI